MLNRSGFYSHVAHFFTKKIILLSGLLNGALPIYRFCFLRMVNGLDWVLKNSTEFAFCFASLTGFYSVFIEVELVLLIFFQVLLRSHCKTDVFVASSHRGSVLFPLHVQPGRHSALDWLERLRYRDRVPAYGRAQRTVDSHQPQQGLSGFPYFTFGLAYYLPP